MNENNADDEKETRCYLGYEKRILEIALDSENYIKFLLSENLIDINIGANMLKDLSRLIDIKVIEYKEKISLGNVRYRSYEYALGEMAYREG